MPHGRVNRRNQRTVSKLCNSHDCRDEMVWATHTWTKVSK